MIHNDNEYLLSLFGSEGPHVHHLPHVVIPDGSDSLTMVLDVVGRKGGVLGQTPEFNWDGRPGVGDVSDIECFRIWEASANQERVCRYGGHCPLEGFGLVLDVAVPDDILTTLLQVDLWLDDMWPRVISEIEHLRWAYMSLSDEEPLAVFVSRPEDQAWVQQLEHRLQDSGIPYSHIVEHNGHETWHLSKELRRLCRLAY